MFITAPMFSFFFDSLFQGFIHALQPLTEASKLDVRVSATIQWLLDSRRVYRLNHVLLTPGATRKRRSLSSPRRSPAAWHHDRPRAPGGPWAGFYRSWEYVCVSRYHWPRST